MDKIKNTEFSVKTVWHCCELEIWSKSLEVLWTDKPPWVHHAKFDTYHIDGVWVNPNLKGFDEIRHLTDEKHVNHLPCIYTSIIKIILRIIFLMYLATRQCLNYRGQKSKTCNKQFKFLTQPWPWSKVKVIKPRITM